jgi:hypothetical protein
MLNKTFLRAVEFLYSMKFLGFIVISIALCIIPSIFASTIDQYHEIDEGQHVVFSERQDSWGVTWSYITTDSQPPTPQFLGIPPGVDNLGVPKGANMHKVFGYLLTDNYSSNGTNLGCILNCNITATFDWTPDYCQGIQMNYTFYNTTSNTTRKYNYHFNLLKWRSDLPFPGVPIDTIIEKIRVNNVNRPPVLTGVPFSVNIPINYTMIVYFNVSDPDELCQPSEENASAIVNFTSSPKTIGSIGNNGQYYWTWTPIANDSGTYLVNISATDSHGGTTMAQMIVTVGSSLKPIIKKTQILQAIAQPTEDVLQPEDVPLEIPQITAYKPMSTIDQYHELNEGQNLVFTERQDSWGVTWSYITTDSQPPTPQFLGIPPGVDNLGVPKGATMPTIFGYLKTDNYSSNGTNLGCILNCNITAVFNWTPTYCQGIQMNYTFYNTTSNTTRKYNYHFNLLKWRSDLPFPGVPIDTIIEKFRVNDINRVPVFTLPATYYVKPGAKLSTNIALYDPDEAECGSLDDSLKVTTNSTHNEIILIKNSNTTYQLNFTSNLSDLICHKVTINATENKTNSSTIKIAAIEVLAPLQLNGIQCSYAARLGRDPMIITFTVPYYNMSYQNCAGQNVSIGSSVQYTVSNGATGSLPIQNGVVTTDGIPGIESVGTYEVTFSISNSLNQTYTQKTYIQIFPKLNPNNYPTLACKADKTVE